MRRDSDFLTLTRDVVSFPRRGGESRPCALPEWVSLAEDLPSPPDDRDEPALAEDETSLPDDQRYEPALAATPFLIEFDDTDRLDPDRAEIPPDAPPASAPAQPVRGPIGSLLIHLLVLALFLAPGFTVPDLPKPIPIQLVLEVPPPPPPVPAQIDKPPPEPHGHLASEDVGDINAKSNQPSDSAAKQTTAPPAPAPTLVPPPPEKPTPPKDQLAFADPKIPPPLPDNHPHFAVPPAAHPSQETHVAAHLGKIPGPSATRDEYLAYLVSMTRQHFDLLPLSMVGGRTGETSLAVLVLADGTIARISVADGSGNPDIDNRIEQMVAACRKFPPLPQWYQGQSMELIFQLHYPEALEHR